MRKAFYGVGIIGWLCLILAFAYTDDQVRNHQESRNERIEEISYSVESTGPVLFYETVYENEQETIVAEPVPEIALTDEEIDMIARLTYAEAGNQEEEGIRLVIDTILNRVDHPKFPDTVSDVIWQKYQFSPMWNGSYKRAIIRDDIRQWVCEEMYERQNYDVIFFNGGGYSAYGQKLFKVGAHYFSSYPVKGGK